MATHLAAVSPAKGQPFELQTRPTPKPGPDELLIAVKSVALNPADAYMRDQGLFIPTYPTVIGFDMSGLVLEVGDNVPTGAFRPGITRVAAYVASFWRSCDPDYGAFQERCLVPWQHAVPLPEGMSSNHAATLPVAVEVALNAWDVMGIPRMGEATASASIFAGSTGTDTNGGKHKEKREALLIWGASSSVGTMSVQTARLLRDDPNSPCAAVYATAGSANRSYVGSLGADRVFDYKDSQVVDAIVSAAKEDGLVIRHCFLATGQLAPCQAVLKTFLGETKTAKISSAPVVPQDAEVVSGVETIFVLPSTVEGERLEQFRYWIGTWLRENLAKGTIRPSPEPSVVGKGLGAINAGLDKLLQGEFAEKRIDDRVETTGASVEEGRHSSDQSTDDVASNLYSNDDIGAIDAHRWNAAIKWTSTVIISSIASWVSFAGAIDSQAIKKISSEFGISQEAETLATAMFLFGFAFGALVTGPVSETCGRNAVYVTSLVVFIVCAVITGCSHSLALQSIFRFFVGFSGSSPLVCAGGSLSDLWTTTQQVYIYPIFSVIAFVGSATGPLVGGYIAESGLSWRWVDWVTALGGGFFLATVVLFVPETFRPLLLQLKSREIQRVTETDKHKASTEEEHKPSLAKQVLEGMWRPFYLFVREPIVVVCALYLSIIYVILFTWLNGFTYIFADTYSFTDGQVGLCFLAMFVGNCCAIPFIPLIYKLYIRALHKAQQRHESSEHKEDGANPNPQSAKPPPEFHLYYAMLGAPTIPMCLFWMAYTTAPHISPWVPIMGSLPFGFGFTTVFISCYQYLTDCYGIWSASALSSVNFVRCLSAGGMMLASMPMYDTLGVKWSLTLLGAASAVMVPVPFAFYKWGHIIRRKSKNALA
ncbi:hypothetical protein CNMCM5793_008779 [Aspergillus hiratsukae]|uniref:Major facilitator superfamily (MFS) profile domain-containing protein n=1 Tax=Aspergillus hiratsukae TaxID=1194566 RepID=A0A8H6U9P4_9EURO|nr:hypothetical protein CNMCM5793_008779 [Aspergillus hiratsukae]KAF7157955.1 hypothetical protein CNMCM6106_004244 [Aspergillus hiratsukae]